MSTHYINYSDGVFLYKDQHFTSQVNGIQNIFKEFLIKEDFDVVIEIGTLFGGLTYILDDIRKENNLKYELNSIDISMKPWLEEVFPKLNINYLQYDENKDQFHLFIKEKLSQNQKTLVLCDGGHKIYEFNLISPFLKSGDFIMTHDYMYDYVTFVNKFQDKIWNFFEVKYADIESSVINNNLQHYTEIDFENFVWGCFKKL